MCDAMGFSSCFSRFILSSGRFADLQNVTSLFDLSTLINLSFFLSHSHSEKKANMNVSFMWFVSLLALSEIRILVFSTHTHTQKNAAAAM